MVLSLQALCLVRLRDGVESGTFTQSNVNGFSNIPPVLRELILNKVLMNRTINDPNCTEIFGSTEFLRGFGSLDTQKGKENDGRYLDRVAESLATSLPNGGAMGPNIKKLSLNLYFHHIGPRCQDAAVRNFASAIRVIAQCQNLVSLDLRLVYPGPFDPPTFSPEIDETSTLWVTEWTGLLNEIDVLRPCLPVLENLSELSVSSNCWGTRLLVDSLPIIQFKKLTALHLENLYVFTGAWNRFLQCVKGTLTELCGEALLFLPEVEEHAHLFLPFPLPRLKTFKLSGGFEVEYSQQFVQTLSECEKLEYASLKLGPRTADEQLATLAAIGALDIDMALGLNKLDFGADRFFKLADLFRGKVKGFNLDSNQLHFEPRYTAAFKRAIDACSDLTVLRVWMPGADEEDKMGRNEKFELEEAKWHLGSLFTNQERASKLTTITLSGNFDGDILKSLFANCLHLDSLVIQNCPQLSDDHLIEWAVSGARPRELTILDCYNISDAGLISIVLSFGEQFSELFIYYWNRGNDKITRRAWRVAIDHCPNVNLVFKSPNCGIVTL